MEIILLLSLVSSVIVTAKIIKNKLRRKFLSDENLKIDSTSMTLILDEEIAVPITVKKEPIPRTMNSSGKSQIENNIQLPEVTATDINGITIPSKLKVPDKQAVNEKKATNFYLGDAYWKDRDRYGLMRMGIMGAASLTAIVATVVIFKKDKKPSSTEAV